MEWLIISCPSCDFRLMVTNRKLLGRPARCPQCGTKFKLEEPLPPEDSLQFLESVSSIVLEHAISGALDWQNLRVEEGRTCISDEQLKKCHSVEDVDRFLDWSRRQRRPRPRSGDGCYLSVYIEWCEAEGEPEEIGD